MYVAKRCEFSGLLENRRNRLCGQLCVRGACKRKERPTCGLYLFLHTRWKALGPRLGMFEGGEIV